MAKWEIIEDNKFKKANGGKSTATRAVATKNSKNNPKMLSEVTVVEPKTVTKNKPVIQKPNIPAQDATRVNQPYYEKKVIVNLNPSDKDDKYDYEKKLMADVDPYLAAQMELAENKNITTGLHNGPLDAIRHTGAAAATATNVFSGGFPYLEVPFIPLKILGTNILGAAHEYTAPGEINWKETSSDLYNNFVGSMIGSLPISDSKKQQMVVNSQKSGVLSNINNGEVDFSKFKQTGGKAAASRAVPAKRTAVKAAATPNNLTIITPEQKEKTQADYDEAYKWTSDYMKSPMYKKMLTESSANTREFNNIDNTRWSNFQSIPPLQILPQPRNEPKIGGTSLGFNGQIQLFPHSFGTKGTYSHELSHSTDRPVEESDSRIIPQSDKNYISQHVPTTFEDSPMYATNKSFYDLFKKNKPKEYKKEAKEYKKFHINYVGQDTETRARLNAIRQGAQQNNLYDPFKEGVTPELYYDKLKNFKFEKEDKSGADPMYQLKNVYSDEEIIYMLNHISENKKENDGTELNNLPTAKNGGKVSGWQIIDDVPKAEKGLIIKTLFSNLTPTQPVQEKSVIKSIPTTVKPQYKSEGDYLNQVYGEDSGVQLPGQSSTLRVDQDAEPAYDVAKKDYSSYNKDTEEQKIDEQVAKFLKANPLPESKSDKADYIENLSPYDRQLIQSSSSFNQFLPAFRQYQNRVGENAKKYSLKETFSDPDKASEVAQLGLNRFRFFPNATNSIEDFVNPGIWLGQMEQGVADIPKNIRDENYLGAAMGVVNPMLLGRTMGSGSINPLGKKFWTNEVSTPQFINNLVNPLAGIVENPLVNYAENNRFLPNINEIKQFSGIFKKPALPEFISNTEQELLHTNRNIGKQIKEGILDIQDDVSAKEAIKFLNNVKDKSNLLTDNQFLRATGFEKNQIDNKIQEVLKKQEYLKKYPIQKKNYTVLGEDEGTIDLSRRFNLQRNSRSSLRSYNLNNYLTPPTEKPFVFKNFLEKLKPQPQVVDKSIIDHDLVTSLSAGKGVSPARVIIKAVNEVKALDKGVTVNAANSLSSDSKPIELRMLEKLLEEDAVSVNYHGMKDLNSMGFSQRTGIPSILNLKEINTNIHNVNQLLPKNKKIPFATITEKGQIWYPDISATRKKYGGIIEDYMGQNFKQTGGKASGWEIVEDVPKFKRGGKTNLNSTVEEEPKNTVKVNQNGQIIEYDPSSPEYKKLYESGTLTSYDPETDAYITPTLKEFTVVGEKPKWAKEKENNQSKYSKDWYIDNYLPKFSRNMGISADNMNPNEVERYNSFINDKTVEDIFKRYPLFDSDYANDRLGTLKQFSPKEIELIKNSSYASALEPNIGDEFDQAFLSFNSGPVQFKNENLTQEEAKEKSNPLGLLAPLSIPYNMTLGNLYTQQQGEKNYSWKKALKGQKPIHNSTAAAIAGDPLNLLGLGIFAELSNLGKIAKLEDAYQLVKGLGKEEALSKLKSLTSLDNIGKNSFTPVLDNVGVEALGAGKPNIGSSVEGVKNKFIPKTWQMQDLSGLHLQSTMDNGAISKIIEPKTGLINTEQALAIIGKESSGADKVALIKQGLGENIPKKMDYNEFRIITQEQLIPLERNVVNHSSNFGVGRLGYPSPKRSSYEMAIKSNKDEIARYEKAIAENPRITERDLYILKNDEDGLLQSRNQLLKSEDQLSNLPLENKTIILGNKNKFGRGSSAHDNPDETLGHIHYLIDAETPDVLTVTQIQSDAFQGPYRIMQKNLNKEGILKDLETLENIAVRRENEWKNAVQQPDGSWKYPNQKTLVSDYLHKQGNPADISRNHIKMQKADLENYTQKQLLDKNHQERYLQELVNYAGERGDMNKVRVPTSETAAKIQGYDPINNNIAGEIAVLEDRIVRFKDNPENLKKIYGKDFNATKELEKLNKQLELSKISNSKIYSSEHQTILKKYEDYGSMGNKKGLIEKLYGKAPNVVTDSKGNTWYEFDIPKSFKEGKGQIKAFSLGGMASIGLGAASALQQKKHGGVIEDPMGQWAHPGSVTRIPSNQITMQGVDYPVLGVSDRGHTQMMYPGEDYSFRGKSVTEYPMMQGGGRYTDWKNKYDLQETSDYNLQRAFELGYVPDETGHLPSVDSETGEWLKSDTHPTRGMEMMESMLNPDVANNLRLIRNEKGKMQYVPKSKYGGEVNFTYAGENHRVYEKVSPTGNGKGIEGHIMVNHPTKNKGKWDTIDLTKITNGRVKTVPQGVASTKKWHKENPEYADGGMIKRADGSYSKRGLWDNIRDNAGSGKKPTPEMLEQERKIKSQYANGGQTNIPIYVTNPNDPRLKLYSDSLGVYNGGKQLESLANLAVKGVVSDYNKNKHFWESSARFSFHKQPPSSIDEGFYYDTESRNDYSAPTIKNINNYINSGLYNYFNGAPSMKPISVNIYSTNLDPLDKTGGSFTAIIPEYKKPVQPYILQIKPPILPPVPGPKPPVTTPGHSSGTTSYLNRTLITIPNPPITRPLQEEISMPTMGNINSDQQISQPINNIQPIISLPKDYVTITDPNMYRNPDTNAFQHKTYRIDKVTGKRITEPSFKNGGQISNWEIIEDLPKAQIGTTTYPLSVPTRTDSLNLYNNAVEIGNYFDKHPEYQVVDTKKEEEEQLKSIKRALKAKNDYYQFLLSSAIASPDDIKEAKDSLKKFKATYDSFINPPTSITEANKKAVDRFNTNSKSNTPDNRPILIRNGVETQDSILPLNEYRNDINDNQYYQREQQNGRLNLDIPMQLFDKRINPDFKKTYLNELNHDGVLFYGYNPIFIKPYDLLTPGERIIVDEKNSTNTTTAPTTRQIQEEIILPVRKNEIDNPQISKISQPISNIPTVSPPKKDYVTIKTGSSYRNPETGAFEQKSFKIDKTTGKTISEPEFKSNNIKIVPGGYKNGGKTKKSSWQIIEY